MKFSLSRLAGFLLLATIGLHMGAPLPPAAAQSAGGQATLQSVTFTVDNMFCALCPVTVRKAMEGVEGVSSVEIDFEAKTAFVTFDPAITTAASIAAASSDAGYPARPGS
ncbi:heavy-metal-associated domain-containing protein [Pelagibius marinus]|uniref:heavy-metal-associated domain-containing protein n=1 Tax=Pelagibius marinus TaxID=2762760 RepID=UPI001D03FBFF